MWAFAAKGAEVLEALGIDETAGTVYHALLAGHGVDIGGLPSRTGLTEEQVRVALEALAALDLVRARGGVPGGWEAVRPQEGLAAIVRRQEEELVRRQRHIAVAKAAATAYAVASSTSPYLEWLEDEDSVHSQAHNLARGTMEELRVTIPAPLLLRGPPRRGDRQVTGVHSGWGVARGVRLLVLYHKSVRDDPAAMGQAAQLASCGAQVRMASDLPPTLLISDKRTALVPFNPDHPGNGALCVREPIIVAILATIFGNAWQAATRLEGIIASADAQTLSTHERTLLTLLDTGLTDEAAARRLGMSVRTTRRQVAALMGKLGASSRFQAGHRAAERGWL